MPFKSKEAKATYYKQYYTDHKDKMQEASRKYREENRDELNKKKREKWDEVKDEKNTQKKEDKWTCPHCNVCVRRDSKARHIVRKHPTL